MLRHVLLPFTLSIGCLLNCGWAEDSPSEVFNQRILPIFRSPNPSSCVQCHLASVDLKSYIKPSHEKTFLSLRDQRLIDIKSPDDSKILKLIRMGEKDADEGAQLIHEKTRKAEEAAFAAWIKSCCEDETLRSLPPLAPEDLAKPEKPDAIIRHARKSRIADSFARNVWSQRMRCFPCHTPFEVDPQNPRHQAALKTRKKLREDYGEKRFARLNFFRKTPEQTLDTLVKLSEDTPAGDLPILNLKHPEQSLLVLKPTSKLPAKIADGTFEPASSRLPVSHMGGLKMHEQDQSHKAFLTWLDDYAKTVTDRYLTTEELPADNWQPTQLILRLQAIPENWPVGEAVQILLYPLDENRQTWSEKPLAFTQGTVTPRRMVNGPLFQFLPDEASEKPTAIRGRFLVKVFRDTQGQLRKAPSLLLGDESFSGQTEFSVSRWRAGFRQAKTIAASSLVQPIANRK